MSKRYGDDALTYEGLKAHEMTHVKQWESLEDAITDDIKDTYSVMKCFESANDAAAEKKRVDEMYEGEKWHDSAKLAGKFSEKYPGKEGMDAGEYEAVEAVIPIYKEHYK